MLPVHASHFEFEELRRVATPRSVLMLSWIVAEHDMP